VRLHIDAAGQEPTEERWEFTAVDAESATIASTSLVDGVVIAEETATTAWAALHQHAAFPAARTTRVASTVEVPAGTFPTWLYTVHETGEDGAAEIHRYHFATALPGPPVQYTMERDGQIVFTMTLLERSPRP
jgi:hypothetical protein